MALKGSLKDFSLTQLLNLVRLAHKTGSLNIDEGSGPLRIYCQDGRLTHIASDGRKSVLADGLLGAGRITGEQLKMVRPHLAVNSDKELALRLMDAGLVSREDVFAAVRQQSLELIFPAFAWSRGSFAFEAGARPPDDAIHLSEDLDAVILEGGRRIRETVRLEEAIPSLDVVPRLTAQRETRMRNVNLTADQWKVISFINGRNSLRRIADFTGINEYQARKVMQELVAAGLAQLDGEPGRLKLGRSGPKSPAARPVSKGIVMRLIDRIRRL